jgi:cytochrome c oxidase subunit 2
MASELLDIVSPTQAWFTLWGIFVYLGIAVGAIVIFYLVYHVVRYRSKEDYLPTYDTKDNPHDLRFVLVSTSLSIIVLILLSYGTLSAAQVTFNPPASNNTIYVTVTGHQFYWNFTYGNGHSQIGNLTIPAGAVVILNVTSGDVFHSFGIPQYAIKIDAIPGRINTVWFTAPQVGEYPDAIRCYELCGVGHALMTANLTVVDPAAFNQWYSSGGS